MEAHASARRGLQHRRIRRRRQFRIHVVEHLISVIIIGITTGLFSAAGLYIGRAFGSRWQKPAQIAGGVVLILIGAKVLLEHLGFLA